MKQQTWRRDSKTETQSYKHSGRFPLQTRFQKTVSRIPLDYGTKTFRAASLCGRRLRPIELRRWGTRERKAEVWERFRKSTVTICVPAFGLSRVETRQVVVKG